MPFKLQGSISLVGTEAIKQASAISTQIRNTLAGQGVNLRFLHDRGIADLQRRLERIRPLQVRVRLDAEESIPRLQRQLAALRMSTPVFLRVDRASIQALQREVGRLSATVRVQAKLDTDAVVALRKNIEGASIEVPVRVKAIFDRAQIQADLSAITPSITVTANVVPAQIRKQVAETKAVISPIIDTAKAEAGVKAGAQRMQKAATSVFKGVDTKLFRIEDLTTQVDRFVQPLSKAVTALRGVADEVRAGKKDLVDFDRGLGSVTRDLSIFGSLSGQARSELERLDATLRGEEKRIDAVLKAGSRQNRLTGESIVLTDEQIEVEKEKLATIQKGITHIDEMRKTVEGADKSVGGLRTTTGDLTSALSSMQRAARQGLSVTGLRNTLKDFEVTRELLPQIESSLRGTLVRSQQFFNAVAAGQIPVGQAGALLKEFRDEGNLFNKTTRKMTEGLDQFVEGLRQRWVSVSERAAAATKALAGDTTGLDENYLQALRSVKAYGDELKGTLETAKKYQAEVRGLIPVHRDLSAQVITASNNVRSIARSYRFAGETGVRELTDLIARQLLWVGSFAAVFGTLAVFKRVILAELEVLDAARNAFRVLRDEQLTTAEAQERITEAIRNATREFGITAAQVGDVLFQLGTAGLQVRESLAALTPVLTVLVGSGGDVEQTVKTLAIAFNLFQDDVRGAGDTTAQFARITDVLTKAAVESVAEVPELVQAFRFVAGSAKLANLSLEEVVGSLAVLQQAGIAAGIAGRSLNAALISSAQNSAKLKTLFGIALDPMKPLDFLRVIELINRRLREQGASTKFLADLNRVFTTRGARAVSALAENFDKLRDKIQGLVTTSGDAARLLEEQLQRPSKQFEILRENLLAVAREGFKPFSIGILGTVRSVNEISPAISSANKALSGIPGNAFTVVASLAALNVAGKVLATLLGRGGQISAGTELFAKGLGIVGVSLVDTAGQVKRLFVPSLFLATGNLTKVERAAVAGATSMLAFGGATQKASLAVRLSSLTFGGWATVIALASGAIFGVVQAVEFFRTRNDRLISSLKESIAAGEAEIQNRQAVIVAIDNVVDAQERFGFASREAEEASSRLAELQPGLVQEFTVSGKAILVNQAALDLYRTAAQRALLVTQDLLRLKQRDELRLVGEALATAAQSFKRFSQQASQANEAVRQAEGGGRQLSATNFVLASSVGGADTSLEGLKVRQKAVKDEMEKARKTVADQTLEWIKLGGTLEDLSPDIRAVIDELSKAERKVKQFDLGTAIDDLRAEVLGGLEQLSREIGLAIEPDIFEKSLTDAFLKIDLTEPTRRFFSPLVDVPAEALKDSNIRGILREFQFEIIQAGGDVEAAFINLKQRVGDLPPEFEKIAGSIKQLVINRVNVEILKEMEKTLSRTGSLFQNETTELREQIRLNSIRLEQLKEDGKTSADLVRQRQQSGALTEEEQRQLEAAFKIERDLVKARKSLVEHSIQLTDETRKSRKEAEAIRRESVTGVKAVGLRLQIANDEITSLKRILDVQIKRKETDEAQATRAKIVRLEAEKLRDVSEGIQDLQGASVRAIADQVSSLTQLRKGFEDLADKSMHQIEEFLSAIGSADLTQFQSILRTVFGDAAALIEDASDATKLFSVAIKAGAVDLESLPPVFQNVASRIQRTTEQMHLIGNQVKELSFVQLTQGIQLFNAALAGTTPDVKTASRELDSIMQSFNNIDDLDFRAANFGLLVDMAKRLKEVKLEAIKRETADLVNNEEVKKDTQDLQGLVDTLERLVKLAQIKVDIQVTGHGIQPIVQPVLTKEEGGLIPGQGRGDHVPALLEPGEFVMPRHVVQAKGVPFFERLRAQHFREGGLVGKPDLFLLDPGIFSNMPESMQSFVRGMQDVAVTFSADSETQDRFNVVARTDKVLLRILDEFLGKARPGDIAPGLEQALTFVKVSGEGISGLADIIEPLITPGGLLPSFKQLGDFLGSLVPAVNVVGEFASQLDRAAADLSFKNAPLVRAAIDNAGVFLSDFSKKPLDEQGRDIGNFTAAIGGTLFNPFDKLAKLGKVSKLAGVERFATEIKADGIAVETALTRLAKARQDVFLLKRDKALLGFAPTPEEIQKVSIRALAPEKAGATVFARTPEEAAKLSAQATTQARGVADLASQFSYAEFSGLSRKEIELLGTVEAVNIVAAKKNVKAVFDSFRASLSSGAIFEWSVSNFMRNIFESVGTLGTVTVDDFIEGVIRPLVVGRYDAGLFSTLRQQSEAFPVAAPQIKAVFESVPSAEKLVDEAFSMDFYRKQFAEAGQKIENEEAKKKFLDFVEQSKTLPSSASRLTGQALQDRIDEVWGSVNAAGLRLFQKGGTVPGTGSGDKVPALLEPGEFVIPKDIVDRLGLDFFERIRALRLKEGGVVKMAAGGPIPHEGATPVNATGGAVFDLAEIKKLGEAIRQEMGAIQKIDLSTQFGDAKDKVDALFVRLGQALGATDQQLLAFRSNLNQFFQALANTNDPEKQAAAMRELTKLTIQFSNAVAVGGGGLQTLGIQFGQAIRGIGLAEDAAQLGTKAFGDLGIATVGVSSSLDRAQQTLLAFGLIGAEIRAPRALKEIIEDGRGAQKRIGDLNAQLEKGFVIDGDRVKSAFAETGLEGEKLNRVVIEFGKVSKAAGGNQVVIQEKLTQLFAKQRLTKEEAGKKAAAVLKLRASDERSVLDTLNNQKEVRIAELTVSEGGELAAARRFELEKRVDKVLREREVAQAKDKRAIDTLNIGVLNIEDSLRAVGSGFKEAFSPQVGTELSKIGRELGNQLVGVINAIGSARDQMKDLKQQTKEQVATLKQQREEAQITSELFAGFAGITLPFDEEFELATVTGTQFFQVLDRKVDRVSQKTKNLNITSLFDTASINTQFGQIEARATAVFNSLGVQSFTAADVMDNNFKAVGATGAEAFDQIAPISEKAFRALPVGVQKQLLQMKRQFAKAFDEINVRFEEQAKDLKDNLDDQMKETTETFQENMAELVKDNADAMEEVQVQHLDTLANIQQTFERAAGDLVSSLAGDQITFTDFLIGLRDAQIEADRARQDEALEGTRRAQDQEQQFQERQAELQQQFSDQIAKAQEDFQKAIKELNTERQQSLLEAIQGQQEALADTSVAAGQQIQEINAQIAQAFDDLANRLEALFEDTFNNIAKSALSALGTIAGTLIGGPAGGAIGGALGNLFGGLFAAGGRVPGPNVDRDVVPAMLTPGEFVVRRDSVNERTLPILHAINRGVAGFAEGGEVEAFAKRFIENAEGPGFFKNWRLVSSSISQDMFAGLREAIKADPVFSGIRFNVVADTPTRLRLEPIEDLLAKQRDFQDVEGRRVEVIQSDGIRKGLPPIRDAAFAEAIVSSATSVGLTERAVPVFEEAASKITAAAEDPKILESLKKLTSTLIDRGLPTPAASLSSLVDTARSSKEIKDSIFKGLEGAGFNEKQMKLVFQAFQSIPWRLVEGDFGPFVPGPPEAYKAAIKALSEQRTEISARALESDDPEAFQKVLEEAVRKSNSLVEGKDLPSDLKNLVAKNIPWLRSSFRTFGEVPSQARLGFFFDTLLSDSDLVDTPVEFLGFFKPDAVKTLATALAGDKIKGQAKERAIQVASRILGHDIGIGTVSGTDTAGFETEGKIPEGGAEIQAFAEGLTALLDQLKAPEKAAGVIQITAGQKEAKFVSFAPSIAEEAKDQFQVDISKIERQGRQRLAAGGFVDSVPAMLTPGEFVVRRDAASRFMPLLHYINEEGDEFGFGGMVGHDGSRIPSRYISFQEGGEVPSAQAQSAQPAGGPVNVNVSLTFNMQNSNFVGADLANIIEGELSRRFSNREGDFQRNLRGTFGG